MSTLDQTHDRDPFTLGGRTAGEPAGDEKIFALIAEFRRVDKEYGRAHAKAESLECKFAINSDPLRGGNRVQSRPL